MENFVFFKEFVVHCKKPYFGFLVIGNTVKYTHNQAYPTYVCELLTEKRFNYLGRVDDIPDPEKKKLIEQFIKEWK